MEKHSILTVGSLAFDTIETPEGKAERVLGGSVNYFSIASSLYVPVQVVGVVGEDFPQQHLKILGSRNIDVSGVKVAHGETFHWVGKYGEDLNEAQTLSTRLNVFEHFDPRLDERHRKASYLFLANIDPDLQTRVLDQVHEPRLVACDSMNFWITGKPDALRKTLRRVDLLSVNEGEAYLLSGEKTLVRAAAKIRAMGPSILVVKRGEYGAILFGPSGTFLAPGYLVDRVVDPTGAGDSFAGALIGYLARAGVDRGMLERDPVRFHSYACRAVLEGCVLASFTVEDFSFKRLLGVTSADLDSRRRDLMRMIHVESDSY